MRVALARVIPSFEAILQDGAFKELASLCAQEPVVRIFVTTVVLHGQGRPYGYTFAEYANLWSAAQPERDADAFAEVGAAAGLADRLWDAYATRDNGGNLRGAVIEGLVRRCLEPRYASKQLDDNVFIHVTNGIRYASTHNIDVVGWDDKVGECHDCKANPLNLDKELIEDLDEGLPGCFQIGIATAKNEAFTEMALAKLKIKRSERMQVIYLERLWHLAPLQRKA